MKEWNGACPRCGDKSQTFCMSWFEPVYICSRCGREEKMAPNYRKAREVEEAELKQGNRNYPGIGLSTEDQVYLANVRRERK